MLTDLNHPVWSFRCQCGRGWKLVTLRAVLCLPLVSLVLPPLAAAAPASPAPAEDGYNLWMRYARLGDQPRVLAVRRSAAEIVAPGRSATSELIRSELRRGLFGLTGDTVQTGDRIRRDGAIAAGTPAELAFLTEGSWPAALRELGPEGFLIRTGSVEGHRVTVIGANTEIGVLYGAFHFLRLVQTGRALDPLDIRERPTIHYRLLDHWDNLDGTIERGYAGHSLWRWEELPAVIDPRYSDYARANASVGINGVVLNNGNADPRILRTESLKKVAALAAVFRAYGIRVYLAANFASPLPPAAVMASKHWGGIGSLDTADPLDPRVRTWWRDKIDEIYSLIPDFGGFMVKADSEGMPGPEDYGRTHADGANLLAEALRHHGGIVMWRAFVYAKNGDPDRMKRSYQEFAPLDGRFADNAFVQVKNGPQDFQPREPFHPLLGAMPKTPLMLELQITQEYIGQSTALVYLAPMWKAVLEADTYARGQGSTVARVIDGTIDGHSQSGIVGVANTGSDRDWTGHLFGQANWYAFGRLAWDHALTAEAIADEWIGQTWGSDPKVAATIKSMMLGSWRSTVDFLSPLGLSIASASNHYDPDPEHRAGKTWLVDRTGIGYDRTPSGSNATAEYHQPLRGQLEALDDCPEDYLLWFHFVRWDHRMRSGRTLWAEMVHDYRAGVSSVNRMNQAWAGLADRIDGARYKMVKEKLVEELAYARKWRDRYVDFLAAKSGRTPPDLMSDPDAEWDFRRIEHDQLLDEGGKSVGRLEKAVARLLDPSHACVEVSGSDASRVVLAPPAGFSGESRTISLWVNIWWGSNTNLWILRTRNLRLGAYRGGALLRFRTADRFQTIGSYPDSRGSLGVGVGRWHHLAVSFDVAGGKAALYVDGTRVAEAPSGAAPTERDEGDIEIGSAFGGLVADVRLYGMAASAGQIRGIYEAEKGVYARSTLGPSGVDSATRLESAEPGIGLMDRALHAAWLDYRPAAPGAFAKSDIALLSRIMAVDTDPAIRTAAGELALAVEAILGVKPMRGTEGANIGGVVIGTPATSPMVAHLANRLKATLASGQGYILQALVVDGSSFLVVAANNPAGVVAGTFALIRRMQLGQTLADLNVADAPKTAIRLVNHWDYFRGFPGDDQSGSADDPEAEGSRSNSIYSWTDLRSGRTARIREWARLLASAGYNAICPTELNWSEKNNFLEHLSEVKALAAIFRAYGIKLYWSPNYLLAPLPSTADALYAAVPDFGGYLLKFGSEGQAGDPEPKTINAIARLLAPHGGAVLIRGFIYGKYSPIQDKVREVIPYKFFTPLDGQYDSNVMVIGKSSPLDFEIREPINPLDGVLKKTRYGTEMMISKDFPMSWLESWKRWTDFDNQRGGLGSLNRDGINGVVGVAMIHPDVPWTSCPLNMVNYYGLGRLAWDPSLTSSQIRSEWIGMTFGPQSPAAPVVDHILACSETVADDLMLYHGYRGVWIQLRDGALRTKLPYPQQITRDGIGADGIGTGLSSVYAPGVRAFYEDKVKSEDLLLFFHFLPYGYRLANGRTLAEDIGDRLREGVAGAAAMLQQWKTLEGKVDPRYLACTAKFLESYAADAQRRQNEVEAGFAALRGAPLAGNSVAQPAAVSAPSVPEPRLR